MRGRQLRENLRQLQRSLFESPPDDRATQRLANSLREFGRRVGANLRRLLTGRGHDASRTSPARAQQEQLQQQTATIRYTSNAPVAVDVGLQQQQQQQPESDERVPTTNRSTGMDEADDRPPEVERPAIGGNGTIGCKTDAAAASSSLDDYWICGPSNRKWGTLTVAASKLAERQARERQAKQAAAAGGAAGGANEQQERDSIAGELFYCAVEEDHGGGDEGMFKNLLAAAGSRTLPRSFRASPIKHQQQRTGSDRFGNRKGDSVINKQRRRPELQNQSHRQQQQFTAWLNEQLAARRGGQSDYDASLAGATLRPERERQRQRQQQPRPAPPLPPHRPLVDNDDRRLPAPRRAVGENPLAPTNEPAAARAGHELAAADHRPAASTYHQRSLSHIEPASSLFGAGQQHNYTAAALLSYYQWQNFYLHQQRHHHNQHNSHHPAPAASEMMSFAHCRPLIQPLCYQTQQRRRPIMAGCPFDSGDAVPLPPAANLPAGARLHQQLQSSGGGLFVAKRNSPARRTLPMTYQQRNSHAPDQWSTNSICAFYPPATFAVVAAAANNDDNILAGDDDRGSLRLRPAAGNNSGAGQSALASDSDDPLTANACLGSNKRKRRLPHIEAKFSIDSEPALDSSAAVASSRDNFGEANSNKGRALASGHLFVRSINQLQLQQQPELEPGYPRAGQRSEQRRWRPPPQLAHVETIGAREKIESYLRHYETAQTHCPGDACGPFEAPAANGGLIEMDKVDELTFQPYYNLPALKYTIKLPIRRRDDGTLLLNESNQLRQSKRPPPIGAPLPPHDAPITTDIATASREDVAASGSEAATTGGAGRAIVSSGRQRRRFGSSSSCPAPPIDLEDGDGRLRVLATEGAHSGLSLESGLSQPTIGHPLALKSSSSGGGGVGGYRRDRIDRSNQIPRDSLEKSIDSLARGASESVHNIAAIPAIVIDSVAGAAAACSGQEESSGDPFYLHRDGGSESTRRPHESTTPMIGPHDGPMTGAGAGDIGERKPCGKPEDRPPPVPPHRSESAGQLMTGIGKCAANETDSKRRRRKSLEACNGSSPPSSSPSPASSSSTSTSASASSSSSGATTTADHDGGAASESLTNDHSVDENYEFDVISSCSSSQNRRRVRAVSSSSSSLPPPREQPNQIRAPKKWSPARRLVGQHDWYTQADKKRSATTRSVERSRLYDFSKQREISLSDCKPSPMSNDYDTVQEQSVEGGARDTADRQIR